MILVATLFVLVYVLFFGMYATTGLINSQSKTAMVGYTIMFGLVFILVYTLSVHVSAKDIATGLAVLLLTSSIWIGLKVRQISRKRGLLDAELGIIMALPAITTTLAFVLMFVYLS